MVSVNSSHRQLFAKFNISNATRNINVSEYMRRRIQVISDA